MIDRGTCCAKQHEPKFSRNIVHLNIISETVSCLACIIDLSGLLGRSWRELFRTGNCMITPTAAAPGSGADMFLPKRL